MTQTFDDMLADAASTSGRARIWTKTLLDLPFDAAKERLINRGETIMTRNFKILIGATFFAVAIVGIGAFWFGGVHAKEDATIKQVHVSQLGDAMQQDDFYSTYGNSALIFTAKVSSIKHTDEHTVVRFSSSRPYGVSCEFPLDLTIHAGQTIAVAAPGGSASREKAGVLLHNCVAD